MIKECATLYSTAQNKFTCTLLVINNDIEVALEQRIFIITEITKTTRKNILGHSINGIWRIASPMGVAQNVLNWK